MKLTQFSIIHTHNAPTNLHLYLEHIILLPTIPSSYLQHQFNLKTPNYTTSIPQPSLHMNMNQNISTYLL